MAQYHSLLPQQKAFLPSGDEARIAPLKKDTAPTPATLYFGGGTPGLFPASAFAPLIAEIQKDFALQEVTLETNPFTNRPNFFKDYKSVGIHRVTLGVQSLCSQALVFLGRKHTAQDVERNIKGLRDAGITNIQVDLIYGLKPGTRTTLLHEEIRTLLLWGATGISAYALTLEEQTLFAKNPAFAHEETASNEYLEILETCQEFGLVQWETSNFSLTPPLHNSLYWHGKPYFGLGTGAHGLLPAAAQTPYGQRYAVGPEKYEFHGLGDYKLGQNEDFVMQYEEPRTLLQMREELFFTLLRTPEGIPLGVWDKMTHKVPCQDLLRISPKLARAHQEGLISIEQGWQVAAKEKIRGDGWALELLKTLESWEERLR